MSGQYDNQYYEDLSRMFFNDNYRVSQKPGPASPSTRKYYKNHKGIDYATPAGTPITVPFNAQLAYSGQQTGYGNRVAVTNPETGQSYYFSHLSQMPQLQQQIPSGTVIGYTGGVPGSPGAGWTTGAHVDLEVYGKGNTPNYASSSQNYSAPSGWNKDAIMAQINKLPGRKIAVSSNRGRLEELAKQKGGKIIRINI